MRCAAPAALLRKVIRGYALTRSQNNELIEFPVCNMLRAENCVHAGALCLTGNNSHSRTQRSRTAELLHLKATLYDGIPLSPNLFFMDMEQKRYFTAKRIL
jgi:hypothetical protein